MLPWPLEDWLTDTGDDVVRRAEDGLTIREQLLHEVWLLDTEWRNGGVAQYFGNRGGDRWAQLTALAWRLPSFMAFGERVERVIGGARDPYDAVTESDEDLDAWYGQHQLALITELRAYFEASADER